MSQSRPSQNIRKSKWEKRASSNEQSDLMLGKPLVAYDNFSSSEEERLKSRKSSTADSLQKANYKTSSSDRHKKSKVEKAKSHSHKKNKSRNKSPSPNKSRNKKTKQLEKDIKKKESSRRVKSSIQKIAKNRSRSRSLSSLTSFESNDSMDRRLPAPSSDYDIRRRRNSPHDMLVNHGSQSHGMRGEKWHSSAGRHDRGRSPQHSYSPPHNPPGYSRPLPAIPIIRRSLTPPNSPHHYSPRRDLYTNTHVGHEGEAVYRDRSRSPLHSHASYQGNQR